MQNPKKLDVYQEAFDLSVEIGRFLRKLPTIELDLRVRSQIIASSTSVGANLSEFGAFNNKNQQIEKVRLCIGETNETEHWLDYLKEIEIITIDQHKEWVNKNKVIRMKLFNLKKKIG